MELKEIIAALKKSKYTCVAGPIENSTAFKALEDMGNKYKRCCLGPSHPCDLNVNDGFCRAIKCSHQVVEIN